VATNQPALPDAVDVKLQICSPAQTACHHGATDDSNKVLTGTAAASASLWQHYAPFIAHLHLSHLTMWNVIIQLKHPHAICLCHLLCCAT
jgi:hypothetical protein